MRYLAIILAILVAAGGIFLAATNFIDRLERIRLDAIKERDKLWRDKLDNVDRMVQAAVSAGREAGRAEMVTRLQEAEKTLKRAETALVAEETTNEKLTEAINTNLPDDYLLELCQQSPDPAKCLPGNSRDRLLASGALRP